MITLAPLPIFEYSTFMKQRIAFLYLKTGAGHLSGAKALSNKLMDLYPDKVECLLKDGFDKGVPLFKFFFEKGYLGTTNYFEPGYVAFYQFNGLDFVMKGSKKIIAPYIVGKLVDFLKSNKITKVVCLHQILITLCRDAINRVNPNISLISIVMDPFTIHPVWFFEKNTELVVFSQKARREAIEKYGLDAKRIHQFPLMLSEQFDTAYSKERISDTKKRLGIPQDKKIVLIAGGGEGLKQATPIVLSFMKKSTDVFLIVVCGKNRPLRHSLEYLIQFSSFKNIKIFGFVSFMPDLMNIADCVITKGGPATLMEAISIGKPVIISTYIRGQELGNMLYITQNKLGWYISKPNDIVEKVSEIFSDDKNLEEIQSRIKKMNIKNGLKDIANFIYNFGIY